MLIDQKRINAEVAKENYIDEDLIKSISDVAFKKWAEWTRKPTSLILKVNYLGKSYYKKTKTQSRLCAINDFGEDSIHLDMKDSLEFILGEYEKYIEEKKKFKNVNKTTESPRD